MDLWKLEHASNHSRYIGWVTPQFLIQHRVLDSMLDQYICQEILLTVRCKKDNVV